MSTHPDFDVAVAEVTEASGRFSLANALRPLWNVRSVLLLVLTVVMGALFLMTVAAIMWLWLMTEGAPEIASPAIFVFLIFILLLFTVPLPLFAGLTGLSLMFLLRRVERVNLGATLAFVALLATVVAVVSIIVLWGMI